MQGNSNHMAAAGKMLDPETLAFAQRVFDLVRAGDAARLGPLLARGADIDARDANGMNALEAARAMGAPDTCARLAQMMSLQHQPLI